MKTSEVCYVCGSRGASSVLYIRPQDSGVSYFSFLESHVPPRGARKPDGDGAVSACTVCSAFLNQQWDTFERTRTPLVKRLYWLKRIDNGAFTGAEMSVQGEYVAQLMGLHGGISASAGGGSPFEYGNHAGISCGKPDMLVSDDDESVASDSTNGALDLSVSPRKLEKQTRKRRRTRVASNSGVVSKKRSNRVMSNVICYTCRTLCQQTLARFIYAFKSSSEEPHFPFLLDISPPAGAMQLTKTGVTQVCADCRKSLTRQWRSYESRGIPETSRVYWINDVAYPERRKSLHEIPIGDWKQKSVSSTGKDDICYLCGYPDGAAHWIATRRGGDKEMVLPFVAQLKCPTGARPIGADGRTRICSPCFAHIKEQWQKFDAESTPLENRTFVLRPVTKTSFSMSLGIDSDIKHKQSKILSDCPVLATVLSSSTQPKGEILNEQYQPVPTVASQKLRSNSANDSTVRMSPVPVNLPNGTCTYRSDTSVSTYCYVCGLDCGSVTVVGKQQHSVHKLYVCPVDVSNASHQVDTKESLSVPFFPFLKDLSPSHGKATSPHENAVQSCTVCYVSLNQQWHRFEKSSDADEQHRWQRDYSYRTVSCDICRVSVEPGVMNIVSREQLDGALHQPVNDGVDGVHLICKQCCASLLLQKSPADPGHRSDDATVSFHNVVSTVYS